uniref:Uncharacterized protein n=1 Tax=Rhizophagus irregularis (strain DAOM 181602 / DAOM 197198 / MUCL 43194) TaxID=747089 RepID=U9SUF5_RHIID
MGGYKRLEGSDVSETWIIPTKKKNFNFFIPDISNKDFTKKTDQQRLIMRKRKK